MLLSLVKALLMLGNTHTPCSSYGDLMDLASETALGEIKAGAARLFLILETK